MSRAGNLWAVGFDEAERAAQVRDEITKLAWHEHCLVLKDVEVAVRYRTAYAYLRKRMRWLDYRGYRRDHLTIGSGVTEAACKTVFTQRLKQSGMTWKLESGQWIVDLRVVHLSGVWSEVYQSYLGSKATLQMGTQGTTAKRKPSKAA